MKATGPPRALAGETRSHEVLAREFEHRVGFFARKVTREFMLDQRWRDELESAGYWGLAKALVNTRDDACAAELSAYVSMRIEGAVLDEARRCLQRTRLVDVSRGASGGSDDDASFTDGMPLVARRLADPGRTPEEIAGERRLRERLEEALGSLEAGDHALLRAYMDGSSLDEIARRRGIPSATIRTRFDRLMRRLRGRRSPVRRTFLEATD